MTRSYKVKQSYTLKSVTPPYLPANTGGKAASTHSEDDLRGKLLDVDTSFRQSLWGLYRRLKVEQGEDVVFNLNDKTLELNLNLFLSQVKAYERAYDVDGTYLIEGSFMEGSSLAVKLKKQLQSGFLRYHGTPHLRESLKEFDSIEQSKYYQSFPFDHLPYWKPDKVDDYEYYFSNPVVLKQESKNKFKSAFRYLLDKYVKTDIKSPSEYEIITAMKTSTILSEKYKYHAEERIRHPYLSSKQTPRLRGRRAVIFVGPANERDSVVWDLDSQEWISKAHIIALQILDKLPMSAMAKTIEKQQDREDDVKRFRKGYLHYVRDIKKCGLTMNVELFSLIKEVLSEKFPRTDFSCIDAYNDIEIISDIDDNRFGMVKGQPFRPNTGHGLGSANSLTTLVQCILFQIRADSLNLDWNLYRSISWNDDLLETIHCEHAHKIYNLDLLICKEFGLNVKSTHTGLLRGGHVFCEEYESIRDFDCEKDIKTLLSINKQRFAPNIYSAKCAIRSLITEDMTEFRIERELESLVEHWGFEFFPQESKLPSTFGGWIDYNILNICTSLEVLDNLDDDTTYDMLKAAFDAEKISLSTQPMKRVRRRLSDLPDRGKLWDGGIYVKGGVSNLEGLKLDLIGWHPEELLRSFQTSLGLRYYPSHYWNDILSRRRSTFLKNKKRRYLSESDLINYIIKKDYPKYYSLPIKYVKEWSTNTILEDPIRSIEVLGYKNMLEEDPVNLLANVCKYHTTAEISCREVDKWKVDLKALELQGHIISVAFDKRYPMHRCEDMDDNLFNYTPLPLLMGSYYYAKYASIPKVLHESINPLPRVDFEIEISGIKIPRDVYVTRTDNPERCIKVAIAVLLCAKVPKEQIGSLLQRALRDSSVLTLVYHPLYADVFERYMETGDITELESIKEDESLSVLTPHNSETLVLPEFEALTIHAREEECPVCMNPHIKINLDDLFQIMSCCSLHMPYKIGHMNDVNELIGDIETLWNLEGDSDSEDDAVELWDPGGPNEFLEEDLTFSDEEVLMSDFEEEDLSHSGSDDEE